MKAGEKKPYLPIFVGSTFTDLQAYRRVVMDALVQLETLVRGMEYFGSKPSSPVDECLRVVKSCKVYIGIFGMRYGSIPDGYDKSMTHLEYDEAQRCELPSLIYIIDEESQPVLPKHVETGPGAEKLRILKEQLKKRHTVSFFTTPDDLRSRILHDVPDVLRETGAEISGNLDLTEISDDNEVIQQFKMLPKLWAGRQVTIQFVNDASFRSVDAETCVALGLEIGASVCSYMKLPAGDYFDILGERDIAIALCKLPKGKKVHARCITAFGVSTRVDWTEDGPVSVPSAEMGLIVKEIIP